MAARGGERFQRLRIILIGLAAQCVKCDPHTVSYKKISEFPRFFFSIFLIIRHFPVFHKTKNREETHKKRRIREDILVVFYENI